MLWQKIDGSIPRKAWYEREREIRQKVKTSFGLLCIQYLYIPLLSNKMDGMDFSEKITSISSKAYLLLKLL